MCDPFLLFHRLLSIPIMKKKIENCGKANTRNWELLLSPLLVGSNDCDSNKITAITLVRRKVGCGKPPATQITMKSESPF